LREHVLSQYLDADAGLLQGPRPAHPWLCRRGQWSVDLLFIAPEHFGRGVGQRLLRHAVAELNAERLDVNEQNPQALGFYLHEGFEIIGRSATDGLGQPYPLLHMQRVRTP
jgi:putative acetyltransferase